MLQRPTQPSKLTCRWRIPALYLVILSAVGFGRVSETSAQGAIEVALEDRLSESEELYEFLDLEAAIEVLQDAVQTAQRAGYNGPVLANIYLMLGICENAQTGEEDLSIDYFISALMIDRDAQLNPYYATPSLEALLERARRELPAPAPDPPPRQPPVRPAEEAQPFSHRPVATVRAGQPVSIVASASATSNVSEVILAYRSEGSEGFNERSLPEVRSGEFFGEIPGTATTAGVQIEYFLAANNASGQRIHNSGRPNAPNVVIILHDAPPRPLVEEGIMSMILAIGTGGGLATGSPLVMGAFVDLNPGIAITPLHILADISFALGKGIELGPFMRLQTVLLVEGVETEMIIGGKLKWFFREESDLRMYISFGLGWGHVRHTVDLKPTLEFVDTTREGPYHGGIGFGLAYMFAKNVGVLGDVYSMVLFDQLSVQLDLNLGILVSF